MCEAYLCRILVWLVPIAAVILVILIPTGDSYYDGIEEFRNENPGEGFFKEKE